MDAYLSFLASVAATAVTILIVAGCGFLLLAMWGGVKDFKDRL